jgi:hypothetical protein
MAAKSPACNQDDESGNEVTLRATVTISTEPYSHHSSTPPDYTHRRMLPVILDPFSAPAVFGESVDDTPGGDDSAVKEFLGSARPFEPQLSNKQKDSQQDTICNKSTSHNEMREALANMFALTKAQRCDATKNHLRPREHGQRFTHDSMSDFDNAPNLAKDPPFDVQFEIDTEDDLSKQHQGYGRSEFGVDIVVAEFAATMHMAKGVTKDRERSAEDL